MNSECQKFVNYIIGKESPKGDKAKLIKDAESKFKLVKDRIIYHTDSFAVRFCYSKSKSSSFSNTVLSLSKLEKYDRIPVFVVLVRKDADNLILLANSSLLKKISHSSKELSMTKIRGSFNGSDIVRKVDDKSNEPINFDYLFALHQGLDWNHNLSRLVEATSGIKPKSTKAEVNDSVFDSIDRAKEFV